MATKGTPSHTTQRCTSPPGLLALVPLHEQDDFSRFLYSQFTLWNKERRRCYYKARRYYKHLNVKIFESTSSFSSFHLLTSTLLTYTFPRSESVKTIQTSIARTFSVSHECTSAVLHVSPLKNKRTPWMESEKILRRSTRPSPPNRSARHPSSRAQILTRPPPLKDTSKPLSTSQHARPSSYRASLLSRPPLSRDPPSYKILILLLTVILVLLRNFLFTRNSFLRASRTMNRRQCPVSTLHPLGVQEGRKERKENENPKKLKNTRHWIKLTFYCLIASFYHCDYSI